MRASHKNPVETAQSSAWFEPLEPATSNLDDSESVLTLAPSSAWDGASLLTSAHESGEASARAARERCNARRVNALGLEDCNARTPRTGKGKKKKKFGVSGGVALEAARYPETAPLARQGSNSVVQWGVK